MKVLWLCNIMLPFIAKSLGQKIVVKEGWLSGLAGKLVSHQERNDITLAICFPESENRSFVKGDTASFIKDKAEGITYYIFREDTVHPEIYDDSMESITTPAWKRVSGRCSGILSRTLCIFLARSIPMPSRVYGRSNTQSGR